MVVKQKGRGRYLFLRFAYEVSATQVGLGMEGLTCCTLLNDGHLERSQNAYP